MRVDLVSDPRVFLDGAEEFLLADPVLNSVLLTVSTMLAERPVVVGRTPTFAIIRDGEPVVGAAMRTPPRGIVVSRLPGGSDSLLAGALLPTCADAESVSGPAPDVDGFVEAWSTLVGKRAEVGMALRIHQLDKVIEPAPVPGSYRLAQPSERDLLVEWTTAFGIEAEGESPSNSPGAETIRSIDERIADDRAYLWDDGEPVSYVGLTSRVGGVVRVGPVYTPPEFRGRGYASALTAAASRIALEDGATTCSLYTDLANPTSNKIYAAVGYRGVCDVTSYLMRAAG